MVYYQAKRDLTLRYSNHWIYEEGLLTPREYALLTNSRDKPSRDSWRTVDIPKYYVYMTDEGRRYPYIGALEHYGKILEE